MARQRVEHIYRKIGQRVLARRQEQNLTQAELASRLRSASRSSIAMIETGKTRINIVLIYELAEALNTEVTAFLPARSEVRSGPELEALGGPKNLQAVMGILGQKEVHDAGRDEDQEEVRRARGRAGARRGSG